MAGRCDERVGIVMHSVENREAGGILTLALKKNLPGVTVAAIGNLSAKGIDVTVCRHGVQNKTATNKSSGKKEGDE